MKVPVSWLTEFCDPGWDPEHMAERLAMTGTEVERVASLGPRAPRASSSDSSRTSSRTRTPARRMCCACA